MEYVTGLEVEYYALDICLIQQVNAVGNKFDMLKLPMRNHGIYVKSEYLTFYSVIFKKVKEMPTNKAGTAGD